MLKKQTETIKNGLNMLQESRCFLILTIENYIYFVDKPVLENPKKKKKIPSTDEDDQISLLIIYSFFFFFDEGEDDQVHSTSSSSFLPWKFF